MKQRPEDFCPSSAVSGLCIGGESHFGPLSLACDARDDLTSVHVPGAVLGAWTDSSQE